MSRLGTVLRSVPERTGRAIGAWWSGTGGAAGALVIAGTFLVAYLWIGWNSGGLLTPRLSGTGWAVETMLGAAFVDACLYVVRRNAASRSGTRS